jgi:pyridoxal 5'-phosphate synthase pdxT subunit
MLEQERLELGPRDGRAAEHRRRDDVGCRRVARQRRDLAEEVTAAEASSAVAVDHDLGLAVEDDEKAAPAHALSQHALALGKDLLADRVRDLLEARLRQIREQRQLREGLDDVRRFRRHAEKRNPPEDGKFLELVAVTERPTIGVLALQGNFREHLAMLRRLGVGAVEVRKPEQLEGLDGLVIPGGESTTFMRLMRLYGLDEAVRGFAGPMLGTCAGMIVLDRNHLGAVDVEVDRNAYGRQVASFEADLPLAGDLEPLRGVFIRAPRVRKAGPDVEVLAELDGEPVLLRQGRFIVASFHPELTDDTRVHERFLDIVREEANVRA